MQWPMALVYGVQGSLWGKMYGYGEMGVLGHNSKGESDVLGHPIQIQHTLQVGMRMLYVYSFKRKISWVVFQDIPGLYVCSQLVIFFLRAYCKTTWRLVIYQVSTKKQSTEPTSERLLYTKISIHKDVNQYRREGAMLGYRSLRISTNKKSNHGPQLKTNKFKFGSNSDWQ